MTAPVLDPNLAMVIMGVIGIIVPLATLLVNFVQNRSIAKDARRDLVANTSAAAVAVQEVAVKMEQARQDSVIEAAAVAEKVEETRANVATTAASVDQKLEIIQNTLQNGPLTEALATIEELKQMLRTLAPDDRRVQALVGRPTDG